MKHSEAERLKGVLGFRGGISVLAGSRDRVVEDSGDRSKRAEENRVIIR